MIDGGVVDSAGSRPLVERVQLRGKGLFVLSVAACRLRLAKRHGRRCGRKYFLLGGDIVHGCACPGACRQELGGQGDRTGQADRRRTVDPSGDVRIPAFLVDYVVVASESEHPQTYGRAFDASYTSRVAQPSVRLTSNLSLAKRIIVSRAAIELAKHVARMSIWESAYRPGGRRSKTHRIGGLYVDRRVRRDRRCARRRPLVWRLNAILRPSLNRRRCSTSTTRWRNRCRLPRLRRGGRAGQRQCQPVWRPNARVGRIHQYYPGCEEDCLLRHVDDPRT